jgi:sugar phosphate isomerase/epimerase
VRLGLDEYTLYHLEKTPYDTFAIVERLGLEGVQFVSPRSISPTLDEGEIREVVAEARKRNLFVEVGIPGLNPRKPAPLALEVGLGDFQRGIERLLRLAALLGPLPVRTFVGGPADRHPRATGWFDALRDATDFARSLAPLVRDLGLRLAFELHADTTSFELVRVVEEVGQDAAGICLDTGNLSIVLEEAVAATRRVAHCVITTHLKDCVVFVGERGLVTQSRAWGSGILPLREILAVLAPVNPDLNLCIEDHDRYFPTDVFCAPGWQTLYPDVQVEELVRLFDQAHGCERRFREGDLASPATLEAIPWSVQAESRLRRGAAHVRQVAQEVGVL